MSPLLPHVAPYGPRGTYTDWNVRYDALPSTFWSRNRIILSSSKCLVRPGKRIIVQWGVCNFFLQRKLSGFTTVSQLKGLWERAMEINWKPHFSHRPGILEGVTGKWYHGARGVVSCLNVVFVILIGLIYEPLFRNPYSDDRYTVLYSLSVIFSCLENWNSVVLISSVWVERGTLCIGTGAKKPCHPLPLILRGERSQLPCCTTAIDYPA